MKLKNKSKIVFWSEDPEVEDVYSDEMRETILSDEGLSDEKDGFIKSYSNQGDK